MGNVALREIQKIIEKLLRAPGVQKQPISQIRIYFIKGFGCRNKLSGGNLFLFFKDNLKF